MLVRNILEYAVVFIVVGILIIGISAFLLAIFSQVDLFLPLCLVGYSLLILGMAMDMYNDFNGERQNK